ncbi:MAG: methylenetetrahydrofolate reductase C-terminal domain-containing protein [Gammaproteobacteria bacterium]
MKLLLQKTVARTEAFFKGMAFDCRECGQCLLTETHLICPMSCPKGLRNGPCGGTINGLCEVYPDKECVWVRIHNRASKGTTDLPRLNPSPDSALFHTSSYLNFLSGVDKSGRLPLEYLDLGKHRTTQPLHTASTLEQKLKQGWFVKTTEIRAPRMPNFDHVYQEAKFVKGHFDAVNVTAYLNGKPSVPSPRVAAELQKMGIEAISQATCRDHTKTSFISEIIHNHTNAVHNVLCLTGDAYAGSPKIKQVFDMDSSLMLYEARYLRETSTVQFTGETVNETPKPFLGAAINPFTTPENIPILRLKQKAAAGADFIQTQAIFDLAGFQRFMQNFCDEGLDKELFLLAGIPVLIAPGAKKMLPSVPGFKIPEAIMARFDRCGDLREEGCTFARELLHAVKAIPGVSGGHLMLLGSDHSVLPGIIAS